MRWLKLSIFLNLFVFAAVTSAEILPRPGESLRSLGTRYEQARGIHQDYTEAYRLYCLAALQGDSEANYNLGWMYFNGRGLKYDSALAMGWFKRAAKLGDQYAKNMLKRFPNVVAVADKDCYLPDPGSIANKTEIEIWVRVIAAKFELDPELVMAVINTESGYNPKALSAKNAQGLMQLIPATAKRFGVVDVWNPVENIIGGTAYLHWLMRHFSGDLRRVLAGYNAGEAAVEKYNGVPPYRETQSYVRRIIKRYKKKVHTVPSDLGSIREFTAKVMMTYSVRRGVAGINIKNSSS